MQSEQSQRLTDLEQYNGHSAGDLNRQNYGPERQNADPCNLDQNSEFRKWSGEK